MTSCPPPFMAGALCALALLSACGSSSSSSTASVVVAEQTIGPEGGTLLVPSGAQAGLTMVVPPQALLEPVRFRVVDESPSLPPEVRALSYAPLPGLPFRIEPDDVFAQERVTIRMPYRPARLSDRAPANVRVQQASAFLAIEHTPESVDIVDAFVQITTREFGAFQVVAGPATVDVLDYLPELYFVSRFAGGWSLELTPAPDSLFGAGVVQWQVTGPGFDESLFFDGRALVGREGFAFRESWLGGYDAYLPADQQGVTIDAIATLVEEPIGAAPGAGQVDVLAYRQFGAPIVYGGLQLDVLKLVVDLGYQHPIGGSGTRTFTFWFSPEQGVLRMAVDGQSYERNP